MVGLERSWRKCRKKLPNHSKGKSAKGELEALERVTIDLGRRFCYWGKALSGVVIRGVYGPISCPAISVVGLYLDPSTKFLFQTDLLAVVMLLPD
jgi:hypothetical protein